MAIGFLGSFLGGAWKAQPWYDESPKPPLWPPQWVFPTVWVGNYALMGSALSQVWQRQKSRSIARPLIVFGFHLLHNISFIPIVYRLKRKSVYVLMDTIALCSGVGSSRKDLPGVGYLDQGSDLRWATLHSQCGTNGVAECSASVVPLPLSARSGQTGI
jgi:hypothetical protein